MSIFDQSHHHLRAKFCKYADPKWRRETIWMDCDDENKNHVIVHQFISFNVKENHWDIDLFL